MTKQLRAYLRLLAGLIMISCLGQLAFPARVAAASAWGNAPGWQREIGFWNVAMYIAIVRMIRADDATGGRTLAIALVVLQFLAATNHAAAAIQSQTQLNTIMSLVNYGCVVFGMLALRASAAGRTQLAR